MSWTHTKDVSTAPHIPNLATKCRWMVSFTPWSLYFHSVHPIPTCGEEKNSLFLLVIKLVVQPLAKSVHWATQGSKTRNLWQKSYSLLSNCYPTVSHASNLKVVIQQWIQFSSWVNMLVASSNRHLRIWWWWRWHQNQQQSVLWKNLLFTYKCCQLKLSDIC